MLLGLFGQITKSDDMFAAEVPAMLVFTQGESKEDALDMVNSAIEDLLEDEKISFDPNKTQWTDYEKGVFRVHIPIEQPAIAFILRQLRGYKNMSLSETAAVMGFSAKNSVAAYEKNGGPTPSIEKLDQFLKVYQVKAEVAIG